MYINFHGGVALQLNSIDPFAHVAANAGWATEFSVPGKGERFCRASVAQIE
jgi:hypothetical protein